MGEEPDRGAAGRRAGHAPRHGVRRCPEEEITGLLGCIKPNRDGQRLVGPDGKATLFDGRTGEPFPTPWPSATCTS